MKNVFEIIGAKIESSPRVRPFIGAVTFAFVVSASAVVTSSDAAAESDEECAAVGRIAERVMKGRQDGVPLQNALDSMIGKNGEEVGPGFKRMVMDAYGQAPMGVQENKDRAIGEFRDKWQLTCMKGNG